MLRGTERLLDGLARGDSQAIYVLAFVIVGTVLIVAATEIIQRRRRDKRARNRPYRPTGDPMRLRRS